MKAAEHLPFGYRIAWRGVPVPWLTTMDPGRRPSFRPFSAYEAEARSLRLFEYVLVPGLPQTADYARAAELSEQAYVTAQVIPSSAGARIGLEGGFALAELPDLPGIVFLDSVADGQTVEDAAIVAQVTQRFDARRAEALPRGASRDMIRKVAEERWT